MNLGDNISDFFKDLKERVSSPFFSSFIIAWLIINWKVPIALAFYKAENLKADHYNSFIDLIHKEVSNWSGLIWPAVSALGYCFLFPFIRNYIIMAQAWFKARDSETNLKYLKGGKVSVSKYIELRQNMNNQSEILQKVLAAESKPLEDADKIKTENLQLQLQISDLHMKLSEWSAGTSIIQGAWSFSIPTDSSRKKLIIRIQENKVYYPSPVSTVYSINNFDYIPIGKVVSFWLIDLSNSNNKNYYSLKLDNDNTEMLGLENHKVEVKFTKVNEETRFLVA